VREKIAGWERVRIDVGEKPAFREQFKLDAIPQVVFLRPDGSEFHRVVGFRSPDQFLEDLTAAEAAFREGGGSP
jgi:hypothetical protein